MSSIEIKPTRVRSTYLNIYIYLLNIQGFISINWNQHRFLQQDGAQQSFKQIRLMKKGSEARICIKRCQSP